MTLSPQTDKSYQPQVSSQTTKSWNWKWEKRHVLLLIAGACLALWFLSPTLKESSWVRNSLNYLPMMGGLVLVGEQLLKLI